MAAAEPDRARAVAELGRFIDGIPVAMVTTIAPDDVLRCRPMLLERLEADATLVFLTHLTSQKAGDVRREPRVNVAFVSDSATNGWNSRGGYEDAENRSGVHTATCRRGSSAVSHTATARRAPMI